ncbi:hypothetical protein N7462_008350 [Penicillium macrosclerotiorum]|uniref:uncharacterized protein n=1 Tax=Penicillium macrosclerotiorum TaxID=303699 RepID=UPI002547D0CA|nr:uncharacterized protein N7462_008350 [Penicillium macrosclerotiorum]KAJ5675453.1 hypothetical protein N7462_008350 [Penicillium macrosclerotiorum]
MASDNRKPQWYREQVQSINPDAQRLLENYSHLAPDEVLPHVLSLRDEAFAVFHYACIGQMRFLSFNLSHMPFYKKLLERLQSNPTAVFLDAGCCFGQEIRFLADQGIPGSQLFGCDLEQVFIDLGYQLFRDKDTLDAKFVTGDLTEDDDQFHSGRLSQELAGKIDVIFASSLFHMWDYDTQLRVATRMAKFCTDKEGVMISGRQMGSLVGGHYNMAGMKDGAMHYRHDTKTMEDFWRKVGEATQTVWKLESGLYWGQELDQTKDAPWFDDNLRMMWWCATRQ